MYSFFAVSNICSVVTLQGKIVSFPLADIGVGIAEVEVLKWYDLYLSQSKSIARCKCLLDVFLRHCKVISLHLLRYIPSVLQRWRGFLNTMSCFIYQGYTPNFIDDSRVEVRPLCRVLAKEIEFFKVQIENCFINQGVPSESLTAWHVISRIPVGLITQMLCV